MATQVSSRLLTSFKNISQTAGISGIVLGCLVLIGWQFDIPSFKSVLPGLSSMKANTAIAFMLVGTSLWLRVNDKPNRQVYFVAQTCAGVATLLGLLTLGEYISGRNFGIDQLLYRDLQTAEASFPGRMSHTTAFNFALLGIALLILDVEIRSKYLPAQFLALIAGAVAAITLIGYLYGVDSLYSVGVYSPMALHTALGSALLSLGILCVRPQKGFMEITATETAGGIVLRRLMPMTIVILIVLGWLRLRGQQAGFYDTNFGLALMVLLSAASLSVILWLNAGRLNRVDAQRRQAEEKLSEGEEELRKLNAELEERVAQRTLQLEYANRESENRRREIQSILDSMSTLNAKVALDGTLLFINKIAIQASGLSFDKLMKTNFLEGQWWAFDPDVQTRVKDAFAKACSGLTISYDEKIFVFGEILTISFSLTPMLANDGEVEYILAEGRDVTQLKRAEESLLAQSVQLETTVKELEAFSYSVSHDLRAPLRSIDGFSKALMEDYGKQLPDEAHDYLTRVRSGAQRMAELIDDLLNLSRVTRSQMKSVPVDLSKLAQGIATELQTHRERKVYINIAPNLKAQGDPNLLQIVLENLLNNAWKFTSKQERAEIEFGSRAENGETVYFVRDNGAGFDMTYAGKLFGAFQRLHAMTEFPGTGIGLATVQRIIHRHGGHVWAEAEVDQGATFFFTLPAFVRAQVSIAPQEKNTIIERAREII